MTHIASKKNDNCLRLSVTLWKTEQNMRHLSCVNLATLVRNTDIWDCFGGYFRTYTKWEVAQYCTIVDSTTLAFSNKFQSCETPLYVSHVLGSWALTVFMANFTCRRLSTKRRSTCIHNRSVWSKNVQYFQSCLRKNAFIRHPIWMRLWQELCLKGFIRGIPRRDPKSGKALFRQIKQYCWWKKSCTNRDVQNPVNIGIFHIFTVELVQDFFHQQYQASNGFV